MQSAASHQPRRLLGVICLVLAVTGWASVPLFLKYFEHDMDAWTSNGWRYGMAALFWLPLLLRPDRAGSRKGLWTAAIWPAFFNATGQVAYAWVIYLQVGPGMMSFLLRTQVVFVTVGAFIMFSDERPLLRRGGFWLGLLLVAIGTVGTIFLGETAPSGTSLKGVLMGLTSGALFGFYALAVRAKMQPFTAMTSFAAISLYTAAIMVLLMLVYGGQHGGAVLHLSRHAFFMLLASAMIGVALGHVFYYESISRLGVAVSSTVLLVQPFLTGIVSAQRFGETLTRSQWIAGTLGILGAALIIRTQGRLPRAPAAALLEGAPMADHAVQSAMQEHAAKPEPQPVTVPARR